jgi:hypothetical protein
MGGATEDESGPEPDQLRARGRGNLACTREVDARAGKVTQKVERRLWSLGSRGRRLSDEENLALSVSCSAFLVRPRVSGRP